MTGSRTACPPRRSFKVIDVNVLRKDHLLSPEIEAAQRGGYQLVLPDLAIYELSKTPEWETTMRASVRILGSAPETVSVAYGLGHAIDQERATGRPSRDLVDRQSTQKFRQLVAELLRGGGPLLDDLRSRWERHKRRFSDQLSPSRQASLIRTGAKDMAAVLAAEEIDVDPNTMREDSAFEAVIFRLFRTAFCRDTLVRVDRIPREFAGKLAMNYSMVSLRFLAYMTLALRWTVNKGADGARDERLLNDFLDLEYIVLAAVSRGLVTQDSRAQNLLQNLTRGLRMPR